MCIYEEITDKVIESIEAGVLPWSRPWSTSLPKNLATVKNYRGINLLLLGMSPNNNSPYWATFRQVKQLKGHVRKGEKGTRIVYWNTRKVKDEDEDTEKIVAYMKNFTVFNLSQIEGIPTPETDKPDLEPLEACEHIIQGFKGCPEIKYGGNDAYYSPRSDLVCIPNKDAFNTYEDLAQTTYHELIHASGHASRLNRFDIDTVSHFGSEKYSREEIIAELGAAMLCSVSGIEASTINKSASYLKGWVKVLRGDKRLIVQAAGAAQRSVDFIRGINHEKNN